MLISKYNPEWIVSFEKIKKVLESSLIGVKCTIEHVGSTSVPNLAAKPIIDIDIIYQDDSEFEKIKSGLTKIGYFHNGNQGIPGRDVFKRNSLFFHDPLDNIIHHLYLGKSDSNAINRHILFRDALRKDESARMAYQVMKYKLAEDANQNKSVYAELKEKNINDFIDYLIRKDSI